MSGHRANPSPETFAERTCCKESLKSWTPKNQSTLGNQPSCKVGIRRSQLTIRKADRSADHTCRKESFHYSKQEFQSPNLQDNQSLRMYNLQLVSSPFKRRAQFADCTSELVLELVLALTQSNEIQSQIRASLAHVQERNHTKNLKETHHP